MKISKNYLEDVYLREEFTPAKATIEKFNLTKALQNNYEGDRYGRNLAYIHYRKASTVLLLEFKLEKITFSELVDLLVRLRMETVIQFPESFRKDAKGWYDWKVAREKDEKEVWRALPIDRNLLNKAKKEGRVSFIVRR